MRFLVTGGAGFIGSNIVERLLKDGHFVRVLDNFSSGKEANLSFAAPYAIRNTHDTIRNTHDAIRTTQYELIQGDIRDKTTCDSACRDIDYVLHQAALRSVPASLKDPDSYNEVNIQGTLNMLQAASKNKVKRFVFASSSSIYGNTDKFPQKETDLPLLISPYALSKLTGEYYCRIFSEFFNLETVCLRYFNVFGPRQALDDEYAVVIPKFIHCILHDEQPPIFGTGNQSRDFTYIDNVVEANILAATITEMGTDSEGALSPPRGYKTEGTVPDTLIYEAPKGTVPESLKWGQTPKEPCPHQTEVRVSHEVFNVANGKDTTILDLVDCLNKITGKNIQPKLLPVRAGDVFKTLADIAKIKARLGFDPRVDFEEGLKRTVEYFCSQNRKV